MLAPNIDDYIIFPNVFSKEPLAPAVRNDDDQWFDIVKWVINTTIAAEEYGVNSTNISEMPLDMLWLLYTSDADDE